MPLAAAGVLRVIGTCIRTPFDVIRQRMQVMGGLTSYSKTSSTSSNSTVPRGIYRNSYHALRSIIQIEGFRALFSGVGVTVLRDIPFSIVYFLAYESTRTLQQWFYHGSESDNRLGVINHMLSGAFAAACGISVSNPLDVVKTRLQTQGSLNQRKYSGILDCCRAIIAQEGYIGFTRGLVPRMMYLCPSAAITFSLYEQFKKIYTNYWGIDPSLIKKTTTVTLHSQHQTQHQQQILSTSPS